MNFAINLMTYMLYTVAAIIFAVFFILYCFGKLLVVWLNLIFQFIIAPYHVVKMGITTIIPVIQDTIEKQRHSDE